MNNCRTCHRIVLTGGPGGGKTTAADLIRREIGEKVVIVPESATLLFSGGFPRTDDTDVVKSTQRAIYSVQRNLEDVQTYLYTDRLLLCDRGTLDGLAYWPNSEEGFFEAIGSTMEEELDRYDAVLFFETAAVGGVDVIEGGNPYRVEGTNEAIDLNNRLKGFWSNHKNFTYIPHQNSFMEKMNLALKELNRVFDSLRNGV